MQFGTKDGFSFVFVFSTASVLSNRMLQMSTRSLLSALSSATEQLFWDTSWLKDHLTSQVEAQWTPFNKVESRIFTASYSLSELFHIFCRQQTNVSSRHLPQFVWVQTWWWMMDRNRPKPILQLFLELKVGVWSWNWPSTRALYW